MIARVDIVTVRAIVVAELIAGTVVPSAFVLTFLVVFSSCVIF